MLYGIIRILFTVGITLLIMRLSGVRWKKLSRKLKVGIIIIWALIVTLLALIPFENLFVTFPSAEAAYYYCSGNKVSEIYEGTESCLIISRKSSNSSTIDIMPKTDDGYKIGTFFDFKEVYSSILSESIFKIYRARNTNDYYLSLSGFADSMDYRISDSKGNTFTVKLTPIEGTDFISVNCSAFIGNIGGGYTLFIGDESLDISL